MSALDRMKPFALAATVLAISCTKNDLQTHYQNTLDDDAQTHVDPQSNASESDVLETWHFTLEDGTPVTAYELASTHEIAKKHSGLAEGLSIDDVGMLLYHVIIQKEDVAEDAVLRASIHFAPNDGIRSVEYEYIPAQREGTTEAVYIATKDDSLFGPPK